MYWPWAFGGLSYILRIEFHLILLCLRLEKLNIHLFLFQTLKSSLYSELQITVNQISKFCYHLHFFVSYFIFLNILEAKENRHIVLDYRCNIPFAVRICLYNRINFNGISSDSQWCSCLQLATDCTECVCCILSYVCKAPAQESVQEKALPLILVIFCK